MNICIDNVINLKTINEIARSYNPLGYTIQLIELLKTAYPKNDFESTPKYELHKQLNEILISNYTGEQIFKYKLFQLHATKKNMVGAFEMKVNNSRADFVTINGRTTCFEIKTGLDNLSKFKKQSDDYSSAFEYNNLIIDERHLEKAEKLIPENFGLWVYKNGKCKELKSAGLSEKLNPGIQISLLTKQELRIFFPEKKDLLNEISGFFSADEINTRFKKALKYRYQNRWQFLVDNQESILPIDIPFFFNTNVAPASIYYC